MKFFKFSCLLFLLSGIFSAFTAYGQLVFEIEEPSDPGHFFIEIPDDTAGVFAGHHSPFGGISAIEYTGEGNSYFLMSDGLPSRYYTFSIDTRVGLACRLQGVNYLSEAAIRGEGIRIAGEHFFLTDERTVAGVERTFVWKMGRSGELKEIQSLGAAYEGEMFENSGFEGIALSPDHQKVYLAMERALPGRLCRNMVPILEYNVATGQTKEYFYPFQTGSQSNGVSEIMTLNDSMLLVVERDYLKAEDRNTVNFFSVNLRQQCADAPDECGINVGVHLLAPKLIFSMDTLSSLGGNPFKVNNVEGATFSADGKYLLLVTDNNFGNKGKATPTQIIALKLTQTQ